jgi:DNA-binding response OmpR family regulator
VPTEVEHLPVLVVEDEWLIAASLADVLTGAGYAIVGPAPRSADAFRLVGSTPLSAAVLDVNLRDETSFCIADKLAQKQIPFIFLSGYSSCDIPERFHDRRLLTKPVAPRELLGALARLVSG